MPMIRLMLTLIASVIATCSATAETITVKYRGEVDLAPFTCTDVSRSRLIERVCFDRRAGEMILRLKSMYYAWCEVPPTLVHRLMAADSMGRFFNAEIKGQYGCQR